MKLSRNFWWHVLGHGGQNFAPSLHFCWGREVSPNPTLSARSKKNGHPCGWPFFLLRTARVGFEDVPLPGDGSPNRPSSAALRRGA